MATEEELKATKERFLKELRHHFQGWHEKVAKDFSAASFAEEQRLLAKDPVYSAFGFASPEYVLVRLMGRVSISIGRRLGEIYDKIPRFVAQARFKLDADTVGPKIKDKLLLDVCVPLKKLSKEDGEHVAGVTKKHLPAANHPNGLGIEVRYNFNPNDSSRLRKDEDMAGLLQAEGLVPIYLVFCTISPRDEAIARLKRAGWTFLVGEEAVNFMRDLVGMDLGVILDSPEVKAEVTAEVAKLMSAIYESEVVKAVMKRGNAVQVRSAKTIDS